MTYESTWKRSGRVTGWALVVAVSLMLDPSTPVAAQGIPLGQQPERTSRVSFAFHSGFRIGGAIKTTEGEVSIGDSPYYGGALEFRTGRHGALGVIVDYQPTTLDVSGDDGTDRELTEMSVMHVMFGGAFETDRAKRPLIGYGFGSVGAAFFDPADDRDSRVTFAMMMGLGSRMPLGASGRVSLRFEARLILEPYSVEDGAPIYCGGLGPCFVTDENTFGPVQGDFSIGLSFLK